MRIFLLSIIGLISFVQLNAQNNKLYTPLNVQWAYENNTRSIDGKPGSGYWINKSEYDIDVELVPDKKLIIGAQKVKYHNNSPDSLDMIVIRLYQDFFKKGVMRDWQMNEEALTDGVFLTKLKVDGNDINLAQPDDNFSRYGTNIFLNLDEKLSPKNSIELEIGWRFEVSTLFPIRMGAYNDTTYMIAYWYPQIAVYDDITKWDTFNYKGTTEFYNDFNDYNVKITVPKEYLVWATGVLQNPDQVLSEKYLKRYKDAYTSDKIINIVKIEEADEGNITAANKKTIWIFKADPLL